MCLRDEDQQPRSIIYSQAWKISPSPASSLYLPGIFTDPHVCRWSPAGPSGGISEQSESPHGNVRPKLAAGFVAHGDFHLKAPTRTKQQDSPRAAASFHHGTCMMEKTSLCPQSTCNYICEDGGVVEEATRATALRGRSCTTPSCCRTETESNTPFPSQTAALSGSSLSLIA